MKQMSSQSVCIKFCVLHNKLNINTNKYNDMELDRMLMTCQLIVLRLHGCRIYLSTVKASISPTRTI